MSMELDIMKGQATAVYDNMRSLMDQLSTLEQSIKDVNEEKLTLKNAILELIVHLKDKGEIAYLVTHPNAAIRTLSQLVHTLDKQPDHSGE